MRILVTGGAGFIGSHVVDAYVRAGHDVLVVDDLSGGCRSNLNRDARFKKLDIRSPRLMDLIRKERPEVINHHAAQIDVRRSMAHPILDADVNVLGSLNLLESARACGVRKIIYASSGGTVYGEPEYLPCNEKHPINPLCHYGVSKHVVEHYLYLYGRNYGLSYSVLRYANVYGPRQDPQGEAGVVAIFAGQMLQGGHVRINGTGEQERDYIYVEDVAAANVACLERGDGEIYNLGCGRGTSVNEIFYMLRKITGYELEAEHGPPKLGETFKIFLDCSKAREELGWEPLVDLADGLNRSVEHIKLHPR